MNSVLGQMYENQNCSAARTLELVGARWSLLLIRSAVFEGLTRFSEFEHRLGIAPNILAKRLEGFVSDGLMEIRSAKGAAGPRTYVVTQKGRELGLVIMALTEWGDRWAAPDGPPGLFKHDACGGSAKLSARCEECGQTLAVGEMHVEPGPGSLPAGP
jgi:DNA-binding HxlR family transcriptional regulator